MRTLVLISMVFLGSASPAAALCMEEDFEPWGRFIARHEVVAAVEVVRVSPRERGGTDLSRRGKGSMRVKTLEVFKGAYQRPFTYVRYEFFRNDDLTGWGFEPSKGERHLLVVGPDGRPAVHSLDLLCVYGAPPELAALLQTRDGRESPSPSR